MNILKGLCHAPYFSIFIFLASTEFQNNGLALLLKTILRQWNCFLSSVATDGKDFEAMFSKITKKYYD